MSTKVRYGLVQLLLDVPYSDLLVDWAADIVFLDADGGQMLETLRLAAPCCVAYTETFYNGDIATGAYAAELTLSDPSGYTMHSGGPAAYAAPAPGTHGTPPAVDAAAAAAVLGGALPSKLKAGTPEHKAARWAEY